MKDNHIHFETLCALAASDQLTERELAELRDHCDLCALCNAQLAGMRQVSERLFLMYALAEPGQRTPAGMRERFIARANREGIQLDSRPDQFSVLYRPALFAVTLLIMVVAITSSWRGLVPGKTAMIPSSLVSTSTAVAGKEVSSSQREPVLLPLHKAAATATYRRRNRESLVATRPSRTPFVMYSPQPWFFSYSIPAIVLPESMSLLTQSHAAAGTTFPDFPSVGGDRFGGDSMRQDSIKFTYAFLLDKEMPLSETSHEFRQPLVQAAYLPNTTQSFKVKLSDFHIPQTIVP